MNQLSKTIITSICILCMFSCSQAQTGFTKESLKNSTPEQRATFLTDTMRSILNLSNDQYARIYNINLDLAKRTSVILKSHDEKMSKYKQIKSLQDERDSSYKTVLNDTQYKLYMQKKEELIKRLKQRAAEKQTS
jgi:hypothetical protein